MKKIAVIYEGWGERWQLGTLADDGRRLLFEYSAQAMQQGLELSPHQLPLRAAAYGDFPWHQMRLPGLVADALPDGWGLLLMDRVLRKLGRDTASLSPLDRLAFIGDRAMGALAFEPAQDMAQLPEGDVQLLALAQQAQSLVTGKDTEALQQLALMGGSPHGARPKVLVHLGRATGQLSTQAFADSTPWLVKFQAQGEHKEVCAIEMLYADLARAFGLDMPSTQHFDLSKTLAGFGVERFDLVDGMRVPVHTLAGLLHANFRLPASVDYPTFLRATRFITRSQVEVNKAFERAVFNVAFNNRDDHAKNISYRLGKDRLWRLAPAYDLTFNTGPNGEHQMDVGGEARCIGRENMLALAQLGGVDAAFAKTTLERARSVASGFVESAHKYPIRPRTLKGMLAAVQANCARLG